MHYERFPKFQEGQGLDEAALSQSSTGSVTRGSTGNTRSVTCHWSRTLGLLYCSPLLLHPSVLSAGPGLHPQMVAPTLCSLRGQGGAIPQEPWGLTINRPDKTAMPSLPNLGFPPRPPFSILLRLTQAAESVSSGLGSQLVSGTLLICDSALPSVEWGSLLEGTRCK